jgi:hypothetical protein
MDLDNCYKIFYLVICVLLLLHFVIREDLLIVFFQQCVEGVGGVEGRGEQADVRRFPNAFSSPTFWGSIIILGGDYN